MAVAPDVSISHLQRDITDLLSWAELLQGRGQLLGDCSVYLHFLIHLTVHGGDPGFGVLPSQHHVGRLEMEHGRCGGVVGVGQLVVILATLPVLWTVRCHVH